KLASGAVYLDRLRDSDGLLAAAIKREQDIATALRLTATASPADIIARAEALVEADDHVLVYLRESRAKIADENDTWRAWAVGLGALQ
ncbi:hypothetical protein, partial [Erwinia amylovora]|uniref:hypothetical protein n=1 Tax=Erwinia amylovora TaxID=552 RepID=UPI0020BFDB63